MTMTSPTVFSPQPGDRDYLPESKFSSSNLEQSYFKKTTPKKFNRDGGNSSEDTDDNDEESSHMLRKKGNQKQRDEKNDQSTESKRYDSEASNHKTQIKNVFYESDLDQYLVQIFKLMVPAMISAILGQVIYLMNMFKASQITNSAQMAGLGLGHSISQSLGVMLFHGLNSGLATSLSQAYGNGQILQKLQLCGHYMNKAHFQNVLVFIPMALLLGNSWFFLDLIGQDYQVSKCAQRYIWAVLPQIFFEQMFDIQKQQLNCYRLSHVQMLAQIIAVSLHMPIMSVTLDLIPGDSILAIGITTSISSLIKILLVYALGRLYESVRVSSVPFVWGHNFLQQSSSKSEFYSVSLPSMIMYCAEGWAFQIMIIMSGWISVDQQAAQSICTVISTTLFMYSAGLQEASSTLIGNSIGSQEENGRGIAKAWRFASLMSVVTIVMTLACIVTLFWQIESIADLFTQDAEVRILLLQILPVVFISFFFEAFQSQRQGVIRGLNIQKSAAYLTISCYYFLAIPLGVYFAFYMDKKSEGLRVGILVGQLMLVISYSILIDSLTDWKQVAMEVAQRLNDDIYSQHMQQMNSSETTAPLDRCIFKQESRPSVQHLQKNDRDVVKAILSCSSSDSNKSVKQRCYNEPLLLLKV